MMKLNLRIFLPLVLASLIFTACETSKKLMDKGNYKEAVEKASLKLESNQTYLQERAVLNFAILKNFEKVDKEIEVFYKQNQNIYSTEKLLKFEIQQRSEAFKLYTNNRRHFYISYLEVVNLAIAKIDLAKEKLFNYYIREANEHKDSFLQSESKLDARKSYESYKNAYDMALNLDFPSTEMINMLFNANERISISVDPSQIELMRQFSNISKFNGYSEYSFVKQNNTDCHIEIQNILFNMKDYESQSSENFCDQIKTGESITIDSSGNKIKTPTYETIEACVVTKKKSREVLWNIKFTVTDLSGQCLKTNEYYTIKKRFRAESISYTGDYAALPILYDYSALPQSLPSKKRIKKELALQVLRFFEDKY